MRLHEITGSGILKPLTPDEANKRAERRRRQQQRIADERARSASKLRDLQADMP